MVISNKSNIPLLLHAPALINELFNASRSDILARRMGDKLISFDILSALFSQSVANDKPKQYSLKKLIEAASNDSKAYKDEVSVMAANLGFMANPTVSGSVPWLTYLNTLIIILILIYIIPCNRFTGVATASMLPVQAHAFSDIQEETVTSISLILAFIVTGCILVAFIIYFWKNCCREKSNTLKKTSFHLTLYAGEDEISIDIGKSAFRVTDNTNLVSSTPEVLPIIRVSLSMFIDWHEYVLQGDRSQFHVPSLIKLKPWQLPLLYRIVPKLRVLQVSAYHRTKTIFLIISPMTHYCVLFLEHIFWNNFLTKIISLVINITFI
jgi:ABC-type multidrug transport system fused ATPase/permease subunit